MSKISVEFEIKNVSKSQREIDNLSTSMDKLLGKTDNLASKLGSNPINFGNSLKTTTTDIGKLTNSFDVLDRQMLSSQKNALGLANNFNKLGQTTFQKDSLNILTRLREIDSQLMRRPQGSMLKSLESEAKSLQGQLGQLQRQLVNVRSENIGKPSRGSEFKDGLLNGLGIPIGVAAGTAFAASTAIDLGTQSLQSAKTASDANRVLAASGKEFSFALDELNRKSETFARLTAQTDTNAKLTVSSITQFADAAGRKDQLDQFTKSLADLSAAKGISADKLPDLISQLKTGQDEVFDRLKGANPSFFYKQYADSIGKTVGNLTDLEKAQVRFDVILKSGLIFNGEAEKRLTDTAGKIDTLTAKWENFKTSFGQKITAPILENLSNKAEAFTNPSKSLSESFLFKADSKDYGRAMYNIEKSLFQYYAPPVLKSLVGDLPNSTTVLPIDKNSQRMSELKAELNRKALFENAEIDKLKADIKNKRDFGTGFERNALKDFDLSKIYTSSEQLQKARDAALKAGQEVGESYAKSFKNVFDNKDYSVDFLKMIRKDFDKNQFQIEDVNKRLDIWRNIENSIKSSQRRETSQSFSDILGNGFDSDSDTFRGFQSKINKARQVLRKNSYDLTGDDIKSFNKQLTDLERAQGKTFKSSKTELGETLASMTAVAKENPLVKTMYDLETVLPRVQDKFGAWGDFAVQKIAEIEKANLEKALNLGKLQNTLKSLDYFQEARRLQNSSDRDFLPFQKSLETVEKMAEFTSDMTQLNRQIRDADYYARTFNPNNPLSANEYFRGRKFGQNSNFLYESSDSLEAVNNLKNLSTLGTGIYGQGAIAEQILKNIPESMVKNLINQSGGFGQSAFNARQLLGERSNALTTVRDLQSQKLRDFLKDQQSFDLQRQFANEKLSAINDSFAKGGLTDYQKATQRFSVLEGLGNNLDAAQRQFKIEAAYNSGKETAKLNQDLAKAVGDMKKLFDTLVQAATTGKGIKVYAPDGSLNEVKVVVQNEAPDNARAHIKAPTPRDTEEMYDFGYRGKRGMTNR